MLKLTRQEFQATHYLKVSLVDIEKSLLHHNRFIIEIISDSSKQLSRKKYTEIKRFSEEVVRELGMREFEVTRHLRSSEQYKSIELLFKKLNSGYLMIREGASQAQLQTKINLRNYLYNLLYSCIQNGQQQDDIDGKTIETKPSLPQNSITSLTPSKPQRKASEQIHSTRDKAASQNPKMRDIFRSFYRPKKELGDDVQKEKVIRVKVVWIKLEDEWFQASYTVAENCLTLVNSDESFKKIVILPGLQVRQEHNDQEGMSIVLTHRLLQNPIKLRLDHPNDHHRDLDRSGDYLTLEAHLGQLAKGKELVSYNFINIKLSNKKNKLVESSERKPARQLLLRMSQGFLIINFSMPIDSTVEVLMPVVGNHQSIEVQVCESRDIKLFTNLREASLTFPLPIQSIYDLIYNSPPRHKTTQLHTFYIEGRQCNYTIRIDYSSAANNHSYWAFRADDKFEGEIFPQEFRREEYRVQKNRFKRIIYSVELWAGGVRDLTHFQYPFQSYFFYGFTLLSILLFDANYLIHYWLIATLAILAYCHPNFQQYARQLAQIMKLSQRVDYWTKKFKRRSSHSKFRVAFKAEAERRHFLEKFNLRTKQKRNIIEKYQRLHLWLLRGQLVLTQLVTMCQKVKNFFTWQHHRKTQDVFVALLAVLAVVFLVPIRPIMLYAWYRMLKKGLAHKSRIRTLNRLILSQIFRIFVEDSHLVNMKPFLLHPNEPINKKLTQYPIFQKKIRQHLQYILRIEFDSEIFTQGKTMGDIMGALAECKRRLVIPEEFCRKHKFNLEWSKSLNSLTQGLMVIYGFLINIPSDRSRLTVRGGEDEERIDEDDSDQEWSA